MIYLCVKIQKTTMFGFVILRASQFFPGDATKINKSNLAGPKNSRENCSECCPKKVVWVLLFNARFSVPMRCKINKSNLAGKKFMETK